MAFLLKHWLPITAALVAAVLAWWVTGLYWKNQIASIEAAHVIDITRQVSDANAVCIQKQKEAENVVQKAEQKYSAIVSDYERELAATRLHPAGCTPVYVQPAITAEDAGSAIIRRPIRSPAGISTDDLNEAGYKGKSCNAIVQGWREFYSDVRAINAD